MRTCAISALLALTLMASSTQAATVQVDVAGGGDYVTIQAGLNAAATGDTVLVAPGTYTGSGNRDLSFNGKDLVLRSSSGAAATVIDCEANMGDVHTAIVFTAGESPAAAVEGFTITRGLNIMGGGLQCIAASPSVRSCIFTDCGFAYGGGIYCQDSYLSVEDCTFLDNDAALGGALHANNAFPTITGCRFENNTGDLGGAVFCSEGGNATLTRCVFAGNTAETEGGGMWCYYSPAVLEDVVFEAGNTATEFGGGLCLAGDAVLVNVNFKDNEALNGGGMFTGWGSAVTLTDVQFTGNHAFERGGGLFSLDSYPTLTQTRFVANSAALAGGGLHADYSEPVISLSVFSRNSAPSGSAISCTYYAVPSLDRVTCSLNENGAAIFSEDSFPEIQRSVIAGTIGGAATVCTGASVPSFDTCCFFGNSGGDTPCDPGGQHLLYDDPLFCDAELDTLTLHEASPCLPANNPWGESIGALGVGCDGGLGVEDWGEEALALMSPYPNPSRGTTRIRFRISAARTETRLGIYSVDGRCLRALTYPAGEETARVFHWDGRDERGEAMASGLYLVKLQQGSRTLTRKLVVAR